MIYEVHGPGALGDSWASINYLVNLGIKEVFVSRMVNYFIRKKGNYTIHKDDIFDKLVEIKNAIEYGEKINITDIEGEKKLGHKIFKRPYSRTKIKHKYGPYGRICYQFDGIYRKSAKCPPLTETEKFLDDIRSLGYSVIRLGKHMSLKENIEHISNCDCFCGVDSGMSHVCHSVGIPMFLVQYRAGISKFHLNKEYVLCNGVENMLKSVTDFLGKNKLF